MGVMSDNGSDQKPKNKGFDTFNVRQSLLTLKAKRDYDMYCRDHAKRLKQLEQIASCGVAPSDQWYS